MDIINFRYLTILFVGLVVSLLAGCATLNQAECRSANWYDLGVANAAYGKKASYVAKHTEACSRYAITPNFEQYRAGWQQGIRKFCTAPSGWRYGRDGQYYRNTCQSSDSAVNESAFLTGYRLGRELYAKKQEISDLRSEIRSLRDHFVTDDKGNQQFIDKSLERMSLKLDLQLIELELFQIEQRARAAGFL